MNFTYFTDICTKGNTGKEKATREKLVVLVNLPNYIDINLQRPSNKKIISAIRYDCKFAYELYKLKERIVVVSRTKFGIFSYLICKFKGHFYVMEKHADEIDENNILNSGFKKFLLNIYYKLIFLIKNRPDGYILNHELLISTIPSSKPILVSYNGISSDLLNFNNSSKILFSNNKRILFIGSCSIWHGLDDLIFSWSNANIVDWELIIVGSDNKKIENNIQWLGKLYNNDLLEIINNVDAFILPLKDVRVSPGSPLKLYEYMAYKKPILTIDKLGYGSEVIKYNVGVVGDIFNPKELSSLLNVINDGLNNNEFYKSLSFFQEISWDYRMLRWSKWIDSNFS
jgi:hypothetical protein